ncbi:MAG: phage holin family protein [Gemmataceae bacterium]|nr:phage holin family protein [Gemmataceae bacterium]MCI0740470.1 phage holin family protein [Gemmataceae bacterium]
MATAVQAKAPSHRLGVISLAAGIVSDAHELIKKHTRLFRKEVTEDFGKTKRAAFHLVSGMGLFGLGGAILCFLVLHLLHLVLWSHQLLWQCFTIVGGVVLLAGGILMFIGKKMLDSFSPLDPISP